MNIFPAMVRFSATSVICLALLAGCAVREFDSVGERAAAQVGRDMTNVQYVALAFDGSKSLDMWNQSLTFARENNVKFTYFVSGVYFLSDQNSKQYRGPGRPAGRSDIGFGGTTPEVVDRVGFVAQAASEGHEIASHANGHFNGSAWSQDQWDRELSQFDRLMRHPFTNNGIDLALPHNWSAIVEGIEGFRAPLLGTSPGLWPALAANGYRYDTSRVKSANAPLGQDRFGIWNFPLASLSTSAGRTLSMDYNFYVLDSNAKPDPGNASLYEQRMLDAYRDYFNGQYNGARNPIHIGHHFSRWNGGAYWRAMKRFAREICGKPDVACVTYREIRAAQEI